MQRCGNVNLDKTGGILHRKRESCIQARGSGLLGGLSRVFGENGVEGGGEEGGVGVGEDERRTELDDIVVRAVCPREDAAVAEPIYHITGLRSGSLVRYDFAKATITSTTLHAMRPIFTIDNRN